MPEARNLKRYWDLYLRITQDERQRKLVALDRFLKLLLEVAGEQGNADQVALPRFSDMKSVSNLLAGELLVDVHHVCSNSADDDISQLQGYLLSGRGATLLKVLNTLGIEGVTCARELADLLATLLPLCCKFPGSSDQRSTAVHLDNVESCFTHLVGLPVSQSLSKFPTLTEVTSPRRSSFPQTLSVHTEWPRRLSRQAKANSSDSTDSSETDDGPPMLSGHRFRRSPVSPLLQQNTTSPLGVFPGLLQDQFSVEEDEDNMDGAGLGVHLEPVELCMVCLDLMEGLCRGDCGETSHGRLVSFILLPHLSHLLLSLVTEVSAENTDQPKGWSPMELVQFQRYLLRTTVTVASYTSLHPHGINFLNAHSCLITVLEAAKTATKSLSFLGKEHDTEDPVDLERLLFIQDVLHAVFFLVHTIFLNIPLNPSILSSGLKLLNDVCDNSLHMVQVMLLHWEVQFAQADAQSLDSNMAKGHIVQLLSSVGKVMKSLKKAKVDYIHTMNCLKRKHRGCEYSQYLHHHHDILGISASALSEQFITLSDSYGSMEKLTGEDVAGLGGCAIAMLGDFLIQLLTEGQTRLLQARTLNCLEEAGLCCCMPPARIQRHLLGQIERHTPGMRNYILCVLTRILMDHSGGSAAMQRHAASICPVCYDTNSQSQGQDPSQKDPVCFRHHETSDSALSSSETSLQEADTAAHPKWRCLRQFLPFLRHTNEALAIQVTQHLLRMVSQASVVFKQELFFCVFLPLLRTLKEKYLSQQGETTNAGGSAGLSEMVVQYCLSALPLLLHSRTSQDMFLNSSGVRLLYSMVKTKSLRRCVLKVFQVLIVLEERNRQNIANSLVETALGANPLGKWCTDSQMVHVSDPPSEDQTDAPTTVEETTVVCDCEGGGGLTVGEAFMKMVLTHGCQLNVIPQSLTTETDHVDGAAVLDERETSPSPAGSSPAEIHLPDDRNELSIMCDIWATCATLFPCSEQFQQNFIEAEGPQRALNVLNHALCKVCEALPADLAAWTSGSSGKDKGSLFQCWLSLIESTLFICLGCCDVHARFRQQEMRQTELLSDVERQLKESMTLSGAAQRAVCDMLLSCATTHRNMHDIVNNHTFAVMHLRIDDSDEQEFVEVSDYCSTTKDSETCHTEQGYEADSEFTPDDSNKVGGRHLRSRSVGRGGRPPTRLMLYPQLCRLVINLLITHRKTLPADGTLSHVLLRLISLAKQHAHIASTLYNQGLVEILLVGIRKILSPSGNAAGSSPLYQVEQCLILDLFLLISQHAFSSYELKTFLGLLKENSAATEALLSAAISLTETFQFKPTYILVFPVSRCHLLSDVQLSVRSVSSDMLTASFRAVTPSSEEPHSEYTQLLKTSSVQEAIDLDTIGSGELNSIHGVTPRSPLNCAPIQMNLRDNIKWPTGDLGFSMSLWLRLEGTTKNLPFVRRVRRFSRPSFRDTSADISTDPERVLPAGLKAAMRRSAASKLWSEHCLHMATVGNRQLQLETWLDPESGTLICRRVFQPQDAEEVVGEVAVANLLMLETWQHLGITYRESSGEDLTISTISVIVNGCYSKELKMESRTQKLWPSTTEGDRDSRVVLGHALPLQGMDGQTGSWQLGNFMIFNDMVLTKEVCFHLFALGPDCVSISQCDSADLMAEYAHHINHDVLHHGGISLDAFTGTHKIYLKHLRENLIAMYTPSKASTFNLYHQGASVKSGRGSHGHMPSSFSSLYHQPSVIPVRLLTDLAPQVHRGLSSAVDEIGGTGVFLFLFARVVEQCSGQKEQAQALHLVFSLISHNPSHAHEFREMGGYAMLAKVMATERCHMGFDMLKVLLDAMLTRSIMRYDTSSDEYVLLEDSPALIRDVHIISELLLAWRVWENAEVAVWHMAFRALELVLRDGHPQHHFNVKQLHGISIVNRLLLICLEHIQESRPSLPIPICQSIISITGSMLGHPPDIHVVMTICDFLLLIHPAASTYVNHTPSEFYFIQKWALKGGSRHGSSSRSHGSSGSSTLSMSAQLRTIFQKDSETQLSALDPDSPDLEDLATSKLLRSQSLPSSPPMSRKGQGFERSQTIDFANANIRLDNRNFTQRLPRTVELDDLQPALKLGGPFPEKDSDNNPTDDVGSLHDTIPDITNTDSHANLGMKTDLTRDLIDVNAALQFPEADVTEAAMFYVETGSDKSSDSSNLAPYLQKVTVENPETVIVQPSLELGSRGSPGKSLNIPISQAVNKIDLVADFFSEITPGKSDSKSGSPNTSVRREGPSVQPVPQIMDDRYHPEDENGNNMVATLSPTATNRPYRSATIIGTHSNQGNDPVESSQPLSSSAPERLRVVNPEGSDGWNDSLHGYHGTHDSPVEEDEKGSVHISVGLLELLCTVLVLLPEADLRKILGVILKPEGLLVMAHHNAPEIRKSIIRLLDVYFHRMSSDQREMFLRQYGFHLVAAQLYQHDATQSILEACFTIMLARPHALEDEIDTNLLSEMSRLQKLAVVPVLGMLESSVTTATLAHGTIWFLIKMFENVDAMVPVMLENALQETLCNTVVAVNASVPQLSDLGADERQFLMEDLQHFFAIIAECTFSTSGVTYYQYFEDSLTLLHALESSETAKYGVHSEEVGHVRNIRAQVMRAVFDYVSSRLEAPAQHLAPLRRSLSNRVGSFISKLHRSPSWSDSNSTVDSQSSSHSTSRATSPTSDNGGGHSLGNNRQSAPAFLGNAGHTGSQVYSDHGAGQTGEWPGSRSWSSTFSTSGFHGLKKMETSQAELSDRFKKVIVTAVEFVLFSVPRKSTPTYHERRLSQLVEDSIEIISIEKDFARFILDFLVRGILAGMERNFFQRKTLSNTVMWQAKDILRMQFSRLFCHQMAPQQELSQRIFALDLVANEPRCRDLLRLTVNIAGTGQKLVFRLYELLVSHLEKLSIAQREEVEELMNMLQGCGYTPLRLGMKVTPDYRNAIDEELRVWDTEATRDRSLWLKKHEATKQRVAAKMETFAKRISGFAMEVTQTVMNAQNTERRKFVEHVKMGMTRKLSVKKAWQQLIQQLTHQRAVWHCPESYPPSWQLDPTEGPCRVRRRLQRCHLSMAPRFLLQEHEHKLDAEKHESLLAYLFEEEAQTSDSAALIYRLHTNEKIQHTCGCTSVTPSSETPGELLIGQTSVYFVGDEAIMDANYTQVLLGNKDLLSMTLPNEDIKEIHKRWYQLQDFGLEIFLTNGKTCLLAFDNTKERDTVCRILLSQELSGLIQGENLAAIQQMWLDGRMTNFEYLTHLNKMAGRSFNDLMQYPIFPFLLASYDTDSINLEDPAVYRNLAKPVAVQHKDREQKYIETYKWLEQEKRKWALEEPTFYQPDPYHYGSHYSNSGTVLHFLVRLPPFTQMFLVYQDKNFDLPDRTFHSMQTAWKLASYESPTDVKELIPEFFSLPEFLLNNEGFNFGVRQDGVRVSNIRLPPWCSNDPRLFTLIHRQALESDHVSQHIAMWIDLVFGFKQTGKAAIDSVNVFHPATYFGIDVHSIFDPVRRNATKTMIKTYGQTPKQLFKTPHPSPQPSKAASSRTKRSVLKSVSGLRWGNYVGSPDQPEPVMAWSQNHGSMVATLVALPTDDIFGLGLCSCLLVMYSKEKGVTAVNTTDVQWAAIVSWGHPDRIVRIQNRRNAPAVNFLHWGTGEQVTCCASVPDCRLLFFGSTSGVISIYNTKYNMDKVSNLQVFGGRQCLYGHAGAVTSMYVCKPFSVLITASRDCTAIIWDLNRLCYVHSIEDHKDAVQKVCVSDTSGDIATVSHTDSGSVLKLHTINAVPVASTSCKELIHCVAFSNAAEGRSVNIVAAGLSSGIIRFWTSWDLTVVRDITWDKFTRPVISLTFTHDSQRIYASDIDGTVAMWEKPTNNKAKVVKFVPFL